MSALGARLAKEYPNEDPGRGITVMACSDVRVHPQIDVVLTAIASLLLVAVGLVLAIACSISPRCYRCAVSRAQRK